MIIYQNQLGDVFLLTEAEDGVWMQIYSTHTHDWTDGFISTMYPTIELARTSLANDPTREVLFDSETI